MTRVPQIVLTSHTHVLFLFHSLSLSLSLSLPLTAKSEEDVLSLQVKHYNEVNIPGIAILALLTHTNNYKLPLHIRILGMFM